MLDARSRSMRVAPCIPWDREKDNIHFPFGRVKKGEGASKGRRRLEERGQVHPPPRHSHETSDRTLALAESRKEEKEERRNTRLRTPLVWPGRAISSVRGGPEIHSLPFSFSLLKIGWSISNQANRGSPPHPSKACCPARSLFSRRKGSERRGKQQEQGGRLIPR